MTDVDTPDLCPSCADQGARLSAVGSHYAPYNKILYTRYACAGCAIQFWSPLRADESVYQSEGFEAYTDYHRGDRPFPRWAEPLFRLGLRPGRSLDIGCADGAVMSRLQGAGFDVHGIDLDPSSIAIARSKFGLASVEVATLSQYAAAAHSAGEHFNLISFFEVLEHQDDPVGFLKQVRSLLSPESLVVGSVPNRNRFLSSIDRKLSDGDLPPHHFLWFSSAALKMLLARAGFSSVEVFKVGDMSYGEVVRRLRAVLDRQKKSARIVGKAAIGLAFFFAPILAVVPYIGYRLQPSHLFFKCRI